MTGPCKLCKYNNVCIVIEVMDNECPDSGDIWGCDAFWPPDSMSEEAINEWETYSQVEWDATRSKIEKIRGMSDVSNLDVLCPTRHGEYHEGLRKY
jgi:hypothetical protein